MIAPTPNAYALSEVGDGALLIELSSGALFRLNGSAAYVWRALLDGAEPSGVARALTERFGLSRDVAEADVRAAVALEPSPSYTTPPKTDFEYKRCSSGYEFWFQGQPALLVDEAGSAVTALDDEIARSRSLDLLRGVAPKLVALRGGVVIHASGVLLGDRALAFSGVSGAGKTTTARALASAGARVISEDVLVIVAGEATEVVVPGEPAIRAWASRHAPELIQRGTVSASSLDAVFDGERAPLAEIAIIAADRRSEVGSATRLAPIDAAFALFENAFLGRDEPDEWRRQLAATCRAATTTRVLRASMPNGLAALEETASRIVAAGTVATAL